MNRVTMALILLLSALSAPAAAKPTEAELQERFRGRLSAVEKLKDAGKIGETTEGELAAVESSALSDRVPVEGEQITVRTLIQRENRDRRFLYELISDRTKETPAAVAKQNAIRNYRNAQPHHYLRTKGGTWVKKSTIEGKAAG